MAQPSRAVVLDSRAPSKGVRPPAVDPRYQTLAIIGLGYVGLPSAVFFAEAGFRVIGADVKRDAVDAIQHRRTHLSDLGLDARVSRLVESHRLQATTDIVAAVREADAVLIMVPTPLRGGRQPDLSYVIAAGRSVQKGLRKGHLVILESTVYPGVTEQVLRPELERGGLRAGTDFGLAYCPERYNPGDDEHTIARTRRIVGGFTPENARDAAALYGAITGGGVTIVGDIRTCEAAKVIENTQRDLNIALMNEFALILERLGLDVVEVLAAASTKWNFAPFRPGPGVGGHCLPKDPHLLAAAAQAAGYRARIIAAGRRINDAMPAHVFDLVRQGMRAARTPLRGATVAVLGLSYKAEIGDARLSPSLELTRLLHKAGARVLTVDPFVDESVARSEFASTGHALAVEALPVGIDAFVLMVGHRAYTPLPLNLLAAKSRKRPMVVDGPRLVDPAAATRQGFTYLGVGAGRHNGAQ